MAGFLFRLEMADGTPAEPPSITSAVPSAGSASPSGTRRCASFVFVMTTQTN
jgi:hypothetical protein